MWVHHHTQQQPTQDIHPSPTTITITTTTNNHCYHYNHSHQQPSTPSKQVNHAHQASLAPASLPCAPAPGCVLWAAFGQHQPASQPAQRHSDSQRSSASSPAHHSHSKHAQHLASLANSHHGPQCQQYEQRGGNG